jgi:hypothetical protein
MFVPTLPILSDGRRHHPTPICPYLKANSPTSHIFIDKTILKMGRRPKFPWHEHKDLCYKLYVEEGKGVTEIAHYFAEHHTVDVDQLPWSVQL